MDGRLKVLAIGSSASLLALAGLAWIANGDAVFIDLVNAALAMCM